MKADRVFVPNSPERVLYWSPLEYYVNCPQHYLWRYGWYNIDLGLGLGVPKAKPLLESREHSIMGTALQYGIERLYNDKLYLDPTTLLEKMYQFADAELSKQIVKQYVDWSTGVTKEEMRQTVREGLLGYIKTMRHNKLLGEYAQCEVDLVGWLTPEIALGGKADLVLHRQSEVMILDGKNSMTRGKYTNPDQLRWYGLVHYLQHGKIPDKLAFIYYRFPAGTLEDGKVLTGLDDVSVTKDDLSRLSDMVLNARKGMLAGEWHATPKPPNCKLCPYETVCDERQQQKLENSAKRKRKPVSEIVGGVMDISFGD